MFEKVLVKPKGFLKTRQPIIDLIDLLLYYDEVHIIIDPENFAGFYRAFSEELVEELIRSQRIILHPTESQIVCNTTKEGLYGISFISHGFDDIHQLLYEFYNRLITDDRIKSRQFADRFSTMLEIFNYSDDIGCGIYKDLLDTNYIAKALDMYLQMHYPSYNGQSNAKIEIELSDSNLFPNAFMVRHNLNELFFSSSSSNVDNLHFDVFPFLLNVSDARITSYIAAQFGSEITTSYDNSKLIMLQFNDLIIRSSHSKENLDAFHKHILKGCFSIGEAFVDKKINCKELIKVLNEAEEFRNWLKKLPNDSSLIYEYVNDISKKTIADNPWIKLGRTILYSIIGFWGITGSVIGANLSMLDSVYADRLLSGWKPNLFIDDLKNKLNIKD